MRTVIKESFVNFANNLEEISSIFENQVEISKSENKESTISDILSCESLANYAGYPALVSASVESLVKNLEPLISNSISVPDAVVQLSLAEKEIEMLKVSYNALLSNFKILSVDKANKARSDEEDAFKPLISKLKGEAEKLKSELIKEKEARSNDLKNFNNLQVFY